MSTAMRWIGLIGGGLLPYLLACGNGGSNLEPPPPGLLSLSLRTPNSDDGIVLFSVSGGDVDSVLGRGYRVATSARGTVPRRIVVSGNLTPGTVVQIQVPDVTQASAYKATVLEVAARRTYALHDSSGYGIDVIKP